MGLVILGLMGPRLAAADLGPGGAAPLAAALQSGQAEALTLTWTVGRPGEAVSQLRVDGGRATLRRCEQPSAAVADCAVVGSERMLTPGQRGQLVSVLRAAALAQLRSADAESQAAADRLLELVVAGAGPKARGRWQLARTEWPAPPDGYGLAGFLDDLLQQLQKAAQVRQPVPIPTTVAELAELRLQLRLTPRTRPGGLLTIENGVVKVTPAEGSLPRSPLPHAWERPLQKSEEEQLVKALQAAQLDQLDQVVKKRAAPAIGDDDGRLATFHLMAAESAADPGPAGKPAPGAPRREPRGLERYLTDLMRSAAAPLMTQLVDLLLVPPPAAPVRGHKPKVGAR